jgi:hypothetical protein
MGKTPHTSCPRGKRVAVVMKDGTEFESKFMESTGRFVVFDDRKVLPGDIVSFTIAGSRRSGKK